MKLCTTERQAELEQTCQSYSTELHPTSVLAVQLNVGVSVAIYIVVSAGLDRDGIDGAALSILNRLLVLIVSIFGTVSEDL